MNGDWRDSMATGWGPDFSEIVVQCPLPECFWDRTWDDRVALGEVVDTVQQHLKEVHGRA